MERDFMSFLERMRDKVLKLNVDHENPFSNPHLFNEPLAFSKGKELSGEGGFIQRLSKWQSQKKTMPRSANAQENVVLPEKNHKHVFATLPTRVNKFDELIADQGLERGSTTLISGGCGTGKTTFVMQSLYEGARKGERGIYVSFEEEPEKIKVHMKKNYGWDFDELEKKGLVALIKFDPVKIARKVEAAMAQREGMLHAQIAPLQLPFTPDRLGVDSLSALSIAFEEEENYRKYVRELFETLELYNSVNFVITETEQNPRIYSRAGVEEFLADGVVVFYNIKVEDTRKKMLEILKLRSSAHERRLIPYRITEKGVEITPYAKAKF